MQPVLLFNVFESRTAQSGLVERERVMDERLPDIENNGFDLHIDLHITWIDFTHIPSGASAVREGHKSRFSKKPDRSIRFSSDRNQAIQNRGCVGLLLW